MNKNQDSQSAVAAVILAAGASRRMGQPKQLLPYKGQTLLSYIAKSAIASDCNPVIVVLGANADRIELEINHLPLKIVKNTQWNEGISSSICCAMEYIKEHFLNINGVVFLTGDQPFISTDIIDELINAYDFTNRSIIASYYEETIGIPALFECSLFSELMKLKGDRGAKQIINKYPDFVHKIYFSQGEIDLDTFEDYQQLISRKNLEE